MSAQDPLIRREGAEKSRRIGRLIDQIQMLTDSTLAAAVFVERKTGRPYVMPHPHCTPQVMELLAGIDWRRALYTQREFDV